MPIHPDDGLRFATCCDLIPKATCALIVTTSTTLEVLYLELCSSETNQDPRAICHAALPAEDPFAFDEELDSFQHLRPIDLATGSSDEIEILRVQTLRPRVSTSSHVILHTLVGP